MSTDGSRRRIAVLYGTRPEAVKMAPVVAALRSSRDLTPIVVTSGQHREMLDQVNDLFGIVPDHDLGLLRHGQSLDDVVAGALQGFGAYLDRHPVDAVVVQGDTSTAFAGALAAYHRQIPVVHVEAGLRTGDVYSPFPEEGNRKFVGSVAALHCAPTEAAAHNLYVENVPRENVVVTGNTVIDALLRTVERQGSTGDPVIDVAVSQGRRIVLVTAHRRESWGAGIGEVAGALVRVANLYPDVLVVLPMHRNPLVREIVVPILSEVPNVHLTEPMDYAPFCHLLARSTVVVTDSGGIQEEAPAVDVPVIVTRDTTERPEVVQAGGAVLVGTDQNRIVRTLRELLTNEQFHARMARAENPFGDGRAAERTVIALRAMLTARGAATDAGAADRAEILVS
ncbi:non-hydrolyzing UDP-N-acetylglucosamine 2-epimerase [Cellulosimicrobium cellulans]|uniref:non-hydrolyzing UDP-N-acetylglucosamine 2-epimerase n=1 Tax=Cellulosimicrobium cellulans TaxID=1710 RepID=UPI002096D94C|nr:UDP-N-acetylglucosamine 2-epimerase (non-hydrolyzing) [Cellulosimicrobium cellulans]MCO7275091.1 UDP-N-acetylglucosamine 2-epimerase (non-hydrolyzing) [Cellulosimicrobium cellulans]